MLYDVIPKFLVGKADVGLKRDQVRNNFTIRKQLAGKQWEKQSKPKAGIQNILSVLAYFPK